MGKKHELLSDKTVNGVIKKMRKLFDNKSFTAVINDKTHSNLHLVEITYNKEAGMLIITTDPKVELSNPVYNSNLPLALQDKKLLVYLHFTKSGIEIKHFNHDEKMVSTITLTT